MAAAGGAAPTALVAVVQAWWHKAEARRCLPFEIASHSETNVLVKLIARTPRATLQDHFERHLIRIYPKGTRFDSSNLPASTMLACLHAGCQAICLNYQTYDNAQQLNRALFRLNGCCGYVLKQPIIGSPSSAAAAEPPTTLHLRLLGGQHLPKPGEERIAPELADRYDPQQILPSAPKAPSLAGASSLYCTLECWQDPAGSAPPPGSEEGGGVTPHTPPPPLMSHTTRRIDGNGLNPSWKDEAVAWPLVRPSAAFVRVSVCHRGVLKDEVIGTEVLPVFALREGYRSVGLRTAKGLRLQLASLLLHVRLERGPWAAGS